MLLVDRPYSEEYQDRTHGVVFTIGCRWGEANDDRPHSVIVTTTQNGDIITAGYEKGPWSTINQAISAGKEIAEEFVAKHWVDSESN